MLSSQHCHTESMCTGHPIHVIINRQIAYRVPPETIDPFAAVFSQSICGAMPRFHLDNDAACRKFFAVLPNFTAACDSAVNSVPQWS